MQKYYHEDIYRVLEANNDTTKQVITDIDEFINNSNEDNRSIERLFWVQLNGHLTRKRNGSTSDLTEDIIRNIEGNLQKQTDVSKRYDITVNGRKLFYVITKYELMDGQMLIGNPKLVDRQKIIDREKIIERQKIAMRSTVYSVALRWEPLDDTLKKQLFSQMGIGLLLTMLAMLSVFFFLSRYLTKPIK